MAKIAYILLCHRNSETVIAQARTLVSAGDCLCVHVDGSAPQEIFRQIRDGLADVPGVAFARRVRCGWGEWSLVKATLNALETALGAFPDASHFYTVSGDCMPIKSAAYIRRFLDRNDCDVIENVDFHESDWIKVGLKEERLSYRHWFNERDSKRLFYASLAAQKKLGLNRRAPKDLKMRIGSQWWCLRRRTVERLFEFLRKRRDVVRFFRTTWIPDETFFQTLVPHLVPREEIAPRTLTFLVFSDYGIPVTFHLDHFDLLRTQNKLFARKVSENAIELREKLSDLFVSGEIPDCVTDNGPTLAAYLMHRGRVGRRLAQRMWERGNSIGRGHELFVIVCKKWHVAERFAREFSKFGGPACLGYLFDAEDVALRDLGNLERGREKRTRHRRAFLKLLFEQHDAERLMICLDPSNTETIGDFAGDPCSMRVLEIACEFDEDYLLGHARRVGLGGNELTGESRRHLIDTLAQNIRDESERLRDLDLPHFDRLRQRDSLHENAEAIARFLGIPHYEARSIATDRSLFN
ncbi:MAG: DUF5928 domain-containing protein [Paracoccaceae bacterium]